MSLLVTIIVRWKDRWASIFALLNSQNTAAMSLTTVAIVGRLKQEPKWRSRLLNVKIDGPAFFRHRKQPTLQTFFYRRGGRFAYGVATLGLPLKLPVTGDR